jgi:hypothetical protein
MSSKNLQTSRTTFSADSKYLSMAQHKDPDPKNPAEEWPAVSRQAKAMEGIDKLVKGDEPIGEKLKAVVDDHSQACDEIKQKLAEP